MTKATKDMNAIFNIVRKLTKEKDAEKRKRLRAFLADMAYAFSLFDVSKENHDDWMKRIERHYGTKKE